MSPKGVPHDRDTLLNETWTEQDCLDSTVYAWFKISL